MAKAAKFTENEKTVLVTIIAGMLLVAGWTGYAAIRGFSGAVNLPATTSTVLAVIAAVSVIMIGVMTVAIRKA